MSASTLEYVSVPPLSSPACRSRPSEWRRVDWQGGGDGGIEGERLLSRMPDRKEKAGADGLLNIEAIAGSYWHLHTQHRSAWTHEIDLRPYKEPF